MASTITFKIRSVGELKEKIYLRKKKKSKMSFSLL